MDFGWWRGSGGDPSRCLDKRVENAVTLRPGFFKIGRLEGITDPLGNGELRKFVKKEGYVPPGNNASSVEAIRSRILESTKSIILRIGGHPGRAGQLRHVAVEVHAVDAFQLEGDVFSLKFGDGVWHVHGGVRLGSCYTPNPENTSRFVGSIRHPP
jgi:hypothetical protein